jgi:hypothetical protein
MNSNNGLSVTLKKKGRFSPNLSRYQLPNSLKLGSQGHSFLPSIDLSTSEHTSIIVDKQIEGGDDLFLSTCWNRRNKKAGINVN